MIENEYIDDSIDVTRAALSKPKKYIIAPDAYRPILAVVYRMHLHPQSVVIYTTNFSAYGEARFDFRQAVSLLSPSL